MQKIYSQAIVEFLGLAKSLAKQILRDEMHISVKRERFTLNGYSYPIDIAVFEGEAWFGYFDPNFCEIGLNKLFIYQKEELVDTLRHELAHYICWIRHRDITHSATFRDLCKACGWGKDVFASRKAPAEPLSDAVSSKIEKLLALANSSNPHEAEAALLKANQLLFKNPTSAPTADFACRRVLSASRSNPKWGAISTILRQAGCSIIDSNLSDVTHLVLGRGGRTLKSLYAIVNGAWILNESWAWASLGNADLLILRLLGIRNRPPIEALFPCCYGGKKASW